LIRIGAVIADGANVQGWQTFKLSLFCFASTKWQRINLFWTDTLKGQTNIAYLFIELKVALELSFAFGLRLPSYQAYDDNNQKHPHPDGVGLVCPFDLPRKRDTGLLRW